jgi:predicted MPP superfamily phosphohydrolase
MRSPIRVNDFVFPKHNHYPDRMIFQSIFNDNRDILFVLAKEQILNLDLNSNKLLLNITSQQAVISKMRPTTAKTAKQREKKKRRVYLRGSALGAFGICTRSATDVQGHRPQWLEVVEIDLDLQHQSHRLGGTRIAHISDLHHSRTVSSEYLRRCVEKVNSLDVDIVALTGDYITYDLRGRYRKEVALLLGAIKSRFGTYACLGNHDYGSSVMPCRRRDYLLIQLLRGMKDSKVTVLQNESVVLNIRGNSLRLVGLGDLAADDFYPEKAFADKSADYVTIALVHNPRCAEYLEAFGVDVVISGHTHGKKSRFPPEHILNFKGRRFHAGMYDVGDTKLYVNRGRGRVGRPRLYSRPEITVLTLR